MRTINNDQTPREQENLKLDNEQSNHSSNKFLTGVKTDYSVLFEEIFNQFRHNEKLHLNLLDQLVSGAFIAYNEYFVYVNPYFAQILGYTPKEIIGKSVDAYIEEEDWHIIYPPNDIYLTDNEINTPILRWNATHRNGKKVFIEGRSYDLNIEGKICKFFTIQDVTNKYDKERQLLENAKIYRRILMAIPEPVFITVDSTIIFANNHGFNLLKLSEHNLIYAKDKKFYEYFIKEDQLKVQASLNDALASEYATAFKAVQIEVNEITTYYEISCIKIDNYIGQRVILSVMRDLTERKENEERIIRSEKLSVIGQLAAGVAHEIRNPLTALKGFTQLLRTKYVDHSYYFDIMANEIDRINLIVNEFMTLAKPHFSSFQYNDVDKLLKGVLSILDTQATLLNIQVIYLPIEDAPKVYCNENQLKQVFLNLIKNAFESMHNGGVVNLKLQYNLTLKCIHVIIEDQGMGMPESVKKRIGEPFLTTKENGTGLGLMVTSRIIEEHHGKIEITSEEGVGTTINVQIPFDNPAKHNR